MGSKLYVGNLSDHVTSTDLEQWFTPHGEVRSAEVIQDRFSGRSKGFGFVQMGTDEAAQTAIAQLDGKEHEGRNVTVNEAKPRADRGGSRSMNGPSNYRGGGIATGDNAGGPAPAMRSGSASERRY